MGSTASVTNNSPDIALVYFGPNTEVLLPILITIAALTASFGGLIALGAIPAGLAMTVTVSGVTFSATKAALGALSASAALASYVTKMEQLMIEDWLEQGYNLIKPGQRYTSGEKSLSLNMRAYVVRLKRENDKITVLRSDSSVWTGPTDGSNINYNIMDTEYFDEWERQVVPFSLNVLDGLANEMTDAFGESQISSQTAEVPDFMKPVTLPWWMLDDYWMSPASQEVARSIRGDPDTPYRLKRLGGAIGFGEGVAQSVR
eukprot:GHVN01027046.1.p1 GENE.GHVN01027046.1~~GHVN01027046.1.p1  ORF type:complete len:260 (-),score=28.46 GHVN01027046.1:93-872(-)